MTNANKFNLLLDVVKLIKPNLQRRLMVLLLPLWHSTVQSVVVIAIVPRFMMREAYFSFE